MTDDDAITRKLDFMRADIEEPGSSPAARLIAGHAALLLAAVEAVLELTEPPAETCYDLDGNEEKGLVRIVRGDVLREAITRALYRGYPATGAAKRGAR